MSFLTFLLYFAASMAIYNTTMFLFRGLVRYLAVLKFRRDVKKGKIKMVTMDEFLEQMGDKKDDIKWN